MSRKHHTHPKAALYTRVSTTYQVDKDSLPHQREELVNYCHYALQIDDYEIFEDAGFSGKNTDRPGFQNMMARVRQGEFTHLVVDKIDRISRNLLDFASMYDELKKLGVTFISRNEQFDTSNAMGEAMLKIILVFAELERHMTSERVSAVMIDRAKHGKWNGANVPLGYHWSEEKQFPEIDEKEAKTVKLIFDMYENGYSTIKIARYLNKHHILTKRNNHWIASTVLQTLDNPFYKGTLRYNYYSTARGKTKSPDEWIIKDNNHPGIVSVEQWEHVRQMRADSKYHHPHRQQYTHIFSMLIFCACGGRAYAKKDKIRKNGIRPSQYYCSTHIEHGKEACDNNAYLTDKFIGTFVFNYLRNMIRIQQRHESNLSMKTLEKELLAGDAFWNVSGIERVSLQNIYDSFMHHQDVDYQDNTKNFEAETNDELSALKQQRQTQERALERLTKAYLYADIGMSEKVYLTERQSISAKIQKLNAQISQLYAEEATDNDDVAFLHEASNFLIKQQLLSSTPFDWDAFVLHVDAETIYTFLHTIIKKIVTYKRHILSITFKNGITHEFLYYTEE